MPEMRYCIHPGAHDRREHTHDHAHIVLVTREPLLLRCSGADVFVTPNQLGFVPPGLPHQCVCGAEILLIDIPAAMLRQSDLAILSKQLLYPLSGCLIPLAELIRSEVKRNPGASIRYLYYFLYEKLLEITANPSICYIHEHYQEEISIDELAGLEHYSTSYFKEWFRQKTGWSPSAYLRSLRLEKAKELLTTSSRSILEIAVQVGYGSHAAFTRAFQKQEHCSPAAYRKRARECADGRLRRAGPGGMAG